MRFCYSLEMRVKTTVPTVGFAEVDVSVLYLQAGGGMDILLERVNPNIILPVGM